MKPFARSFFIPVLMAIVGACAPSPSVPESPFILGGELSNSAVTCEEDIAEVMPRMKAMGLNTVLVPVYWEFLEPRECVFDFRLVDCILREARRQDLKVVVLWFGAWKNSMSCYAPAWFKQDTERFPRARTEDGKPLEIASCFSEEVFQADSRAFDALMEHLDSRGRGVVTMVQVENEIGMLESARDHSSLADAVYAQGVPPELTDRLREKRGTLHPWMQARFTGTGSSWTEVFGDDVFTDEIFMAWYYAKYVGRLCETARRYSSLPLYVNAAMNSRGRLPGQYPSAGPLAHLIDVWRAGAPQLLCLAPDIYDTGFKSWADQYAVADNPLFIPESRCCEDSGARALYAFGEHRALGFAPFAIDQAAPREAENIGRAYGLVRQLSGLLAQEETVSWGLLFDRQDVERVIPDENTVITCRHYYTLPWDARATDGSVWPEGGAVLLKLAENDYLLAGTGVVVSFATAYEQAHEARRLLGEDGFELAGGGTRTGGVKEAFDGPRKGILSVDEVCVDGQGQMSFLRRHNGDQDHQGRHARISCDDWKILHIRLYDYE